MDDDRQFLEEVVGVPLGPEPVEEPAYVTPLSEEGWSLVEEALERGGFTRERTPQKEVTMDRIPDAEAARVARMLRRLPRDRAAEVLQERRDRVGEAQFREDARAITKAAGEIDRMADERRFPPVQGAGDRITDVLGVPPSVPPAGETDPLYEAVLRRSGAEHPDSRYRRQLGR